MKYLLDTHILVWMIEKPSELSKDVTEIISQSNALYVSVESLREIAIKSKNGEIILKTPFKKFCTQTLSAFGVKIINTDINNILAFYELEFKPNHKDPFDHLIISTAINGKFTLISSDKKFIYYVKQGLELQIN